jgi:hypothetical protein
MKPVLFLIVTFFALSVKAQSDSSKMAEVYFLRSNNVMDLKRHKFFIDGNFIGKIGENKYMIRKVVAGTHQFSVQFNGKKSKKGSEKLVIDMEPGKKYYVQDVIEQKYPFPNVYCIELTEQSAQRIIPYLKPMKD